MNGFRSLVVEGEGLVCDSDLREIRGEPIVRFLGRNKLAVWVALAQEDHLGRSLKTSIRLMLQGSQCMRCCIIRGTDMVTPNHGGISAYETAVCILGENGL